MNSHSTSFLVDAFGAVTVSPGEPAQLRGSADRGPGVVARLARALAHAVGTRVHGASAQG